MTLTQAVILEPPCIHYASKFKVFSMLFYKSKSLKLHDSWSSCCYHQVPGSMYPCHHHHVSPLPERLTSGATRSKKHGLCVGLEHCEHRHHHAPGSVWCSRKYPCQYHCGVVHSHWMVPCIHLTRIKTTSSLNLVRVRSLSLNLNLSLYIVICQRSLRSCFPSRGEAPEEPVTPAASPYESACSAHVACPKFDGWTWGIRVPLLLPSFQGVWNERKKDHKWHAVTMTLMFFSFFLRGFHPHQVAQPQAQCAGQQGECCPTDTGILMGCCHLTEHYGWSGGVRNFSSSVTTNNFWSISEEVDLAV